MKNVLQVIFIPVMLVLFIPAAILYLILRFLAHFIYDSNMYCGIEPYDQEALEYREKAEYLRIKKKYKL